MNDSQSKRSIRDIVSKKHTKSHKGNIPGEKRQRRSKQRSSIALWVAIGFVILFVFFVLSLVFSGSKILAYPQEATVAVDGVYEARRTAAEGIVPYEIMTVTKEGSKEVDPTGESFVEERANGVIQIYNDFDGEDQRLIANTRFESPDGNIYRIREPVTVPGKTGNTPGTITAQVWAEDPGEEFNVGSGTRFTIPGLEGDQRYEAFWAEADTAVDGGFRGVTQTVSPEDKEQAIREIQESLRTQVLEDTHAQTPQNFTLFEDALVLSFEPLTNESAENDKVRVRQKAVVQAVIFNEQQLAAFFANRILENYNGEEVRIENIDELQFTLEDSDAFAESIQTGFPFSLVGNAHFIWQFNRADLASDLMGASKSDINQILANYPSIERAEVILRPFWRRSFPEEVREIEIEVRTDGE
ncbi:MAG: hypothetical protein WDZ70_00800 [Candidatus Paceibacterota bacterium]